MSLAFNNVFLPSRMLAAEPQVPTFAWVCAQMVQMGSVQQSWCDDQASLYARIGVTDSVGRVRPSSEICTDSKRSSWIEAIWAAKSRDLGFALFSAGAFWEKADECFSFLSESSSLHSAWRWRAAEAVLYSYVANWEPGYGASADQVANDLAKARQYLNESLRHDYLLPNSDLQIVRQRLSAIGSM